MKSAAFSFFIHYLLLRLQTDIFQIQTEILQIQTEILQIRTEIQIQTEMLCFTCLQLTASLSSQKFSWLSRNLVGIRI